VLTGSCLCKGVAYEVDAVPGAIVHCHCETCRKTHGSAFSSVSSVPRDKFRWTRGKELLSSYESSSENFATSARDAARISLRNEPTATRCY